MYRSFAKTCITRRRAAEEAWGVEVPCVDPTEGEASPVEEPCADPRIR